MARISLRAYNRDIETMIDQNQIDEAIAHCRHILGRYPKHIATYRLIGKALLEAQRFSDAADVFHRVLSSVPDDFIAHLGMSIIREDENNLDGAIWHMERAFEVQPSNAAVQAELRRLYGNRDGLTPQKIQLTRGALARMSAKSNLYSQAIAELRSALTDDPQRPDLQVVLAAMYAQTGSRNEAIEICNALISKLPFCMEANLILTELLPDTERADEAQVFSDRLQELDPYFSHLSPVATTVDLVPDSAVTIERLDYLGEIVTSRETGQPDWATSLGVTIDEDYELQEEAPEWLSPKPEQTSTSDEIKVEEEPSAKDIDVYEGSGTTEEPEVHHPEAIETEEITDWMDEPDEQTLSDTDEVTVEETPEWLHSVMEAQTEGETPPIEATAVVGFGLSDDLSDETHIPEETEESSVGEIEGDLSMDVESSVEESEDKEAPPDVHPEEILGKPAAPLDGIVIGATAASLASEPDSEAAELQEPEDTQVDQESISEEPPLTEEAPPEEFPVETLVPEQSLESEALIPEEDEPDIPDWLHGLGEGLSEEAPLETVSESSAEDEASDTEEEISLEIGEGEPEEGEEEFPESIPEWLSTVSKGELPDTESADEFEASVAGEEQDIVRAEIPVWLRKMELEHLAEMESVTDVESLQSLDFDSDITDLYGDDVPAWLVSAMEGSAIDESLEYETTEDVEGIIAGLAEEEAITSEAAEELLAEEVLPQEGIVQESIAEETFTEESRREEPISIEDAVEEVIAEVAEPEEVTSEVRAKDEAIPVVAAIEEAISEETIEEEVFDEGPVEEIQVEEALLEGDTQPIVIGDQIGKEERVALIQPESEGIPESAEEVTAEIEGISEFLAEAEGETPESDEIPFPTGEDEAAAMAWLESLAERQGVDEEELLTSPEERMGEPPEWIKESVVAEEPSTEEEIPERIEEIAAATVAGIAIEKELRKEGDEEISITAEEEIPAEEFPEWVPETIAEEEEPPESDIETPVPAAGETVEVEEEGVEIVEEVQPIEADEQPAELVPEWLMGLAPEEEIDVEEPETGLTPSITAEEVPALDEVPEEKITAKVDLNAASISQLEKIPGLGFILAQNIVSYRDSAGPFHSIDELKHVPDLSADIIEDLRNYLTVEIVEEISVPVSSHPELENAWNAITSGDISSAIDQYTQIINRDEHLDEIIRDLQEALSRYPVDASLFQTLGDAYLHANMLQEALDAYNRAEDLIK